MDITKFYSFLKFIKHIKAVLHNALEQIESAKEIMRFTWQFSVGIPPLNAGAQI